MEFDFSDEKNKILFKKRSITFNQIIDAIAENGILLRIKHPNEVKYPNQWMMVVEFNNYTYCIPYVVTGKTYYLKTIYPNRKFLYLLTSNEEEKND
jgi:uncharacterized DUF497 family protein